MSSEKQEVQTEPQEQEQEQTDLYVPNWEFIERVPTVADVEKMLATLPDCYGVRYVDYADYVQALPQRKKVKRPVPGRPGVLQDAYIDSWTLYMSVAGRIKMLADISVANEWAVEFEPEPFTPTQVPGMLQMDDRIVYREYVTVRAFKDSDKPGGLIGRRPGTAWVPASGGKQAAGSNPYEKVETAARGRAIAAWGIGILPGSGVASVEEMLGVRENEQAMNREQQRQADVRETKQNRDEILQDLLAVSEELRQERGIEHEESEEKTGEYLTQRLGVRNAYVDGRIIWDNVKTGQLVLLRNSLRTALAQIRDARSEI